MTASARKGWCPGALRPMETGDGLLVRLRPSGGMLRIDAAQAIAACAIRYGNGLIDLSSRANLQLRGVSLATLDDLTLELSDLGLLDATPEAEAIRNVVASPLAGVDPGAVLDIRPVVAALEARLTGDSPLQALPGKFGFLIDDGGQLTLSQVRADVRFEAFAGVEGPRFRITLGDTVAIGDCAPGEVADSAARIAAAFLQSCGGADAPRRMAELAASAAFTAFADAAGFAVDRRPMPPPRQFDMSLVVGHRHIAERSQMEMSDRRGDLIPPPCGEGGWPKSFIWASRVGVSHNGSLACGSPEVSEARSQLTSTASVAAPPPVTSLAALATCHPPHKGEGLDRGTGSFSHAIAVRQAGDMHYVGAAAPFGRLSGAALTGLAALAARHGATELRLTPWRAILIAEISAGDAEHLVAELAANSFIVDPRDPRLYVAACPGAPACPRATTFVQHDAERLAVLLRPLNPTAPMLHVSGCAKGCAHARPTRFTLVGNAGRYDLVENGTARDRAVAAGLSEAEIAGDLAARVQRQLEERAFAKFA